MAPQPAPDLDGPGPLYEKVRAELEKMALDRPLDDVDPLPPESRLVEQFGVSRGTLRRAIEELARDGLLSVEQGRGTYVNQEERMRRVVLQRLASVARPDSRFHLDLRSFVPDFAGRAAADAEVLGLDEWRRARTVFLAPDNSVRQLRVEALAAGKRVLVPTYGLRRGFVLLDGARIAAEDRRLAATLDAMEDFGRAVSPGELRGIGKVDLVVTGATAVTTDGRQIGSVERYLALEWALMVEAAVFGDGLSVIAVVHDCQVVDLTVRANPDCVVDLVITPTRVIRCRAGGRVTPLRRRKR